MPIENIALADGLESYREIGGDWNMNASSRDLRYSHYLPDILFNLPGMISEQQD